MQGETKGTGTGPGEGEADRISIKSLKVGDIVDLPIRVGKQDPFMVPVLIIDSRTVYGRTDWQVTPAHGDGSAWVREDGLLSGVGVQAQTPKGSAKAGVYRNQGRKKGYAHRDHRTDEEIRAMRAQGVVFEGDDKADEDYAYTRKGTKRLASQQEEE